MKIPLHQAANQVRDMIDDYGFALAIYKVSKQTGYSTKALSAEIRWTKNKSKNNYRQTVPEWVKDSKDWE